MSSSESTGAMPEAIGPYRVDARIGRGGMGEVYRGHDARLDRPVALKHVKPDAKDPATARERFRREARALARVRHPAVVEVYDWVEDEDGDWLIMELLEGHLLSARIAEGPLEVRRALEIARDVAGGLAAVHAHGIVHRDLSPANVMLVPPGLEDTASGRVSADRVKILDFGLAKRVASMDGVPLTETISSEGQLLGTVRYMSPEQAAGHRVDPRSDLFSLGVVLYEMLTGASPFAGETAVETLTRICTVAETPAHRRDPALPEAVSELAGRMLKKEPERRLQTAAEVSEALDALAAGVATGRPDRELWAALPASGSDSDATSPTEVGVHVAGVAVGGAHVRTLLLSDLVDSTTLVDKLGDERAAGIFEQHDRMARDLLKRCQGREIDKSDGFLMLFERPLDAVRFALGYHAASAEISEREGMEVSSRVGIHVGEVVLRVNSAEDVAQGAKPLEVDGLAKAMAARLMSLAGARQTLISRGVYDLGRRAAVGAAKVPEGLHWVEHGRYRMQGAEEPVEVFEVGAVGVAPLVAPKDTKKVKRVREVSGRLSGWRLRVAGGAALVVLTLAGLGARQVWLLREPPNPTYVAVPAPVIQSASEERVAELKIEAGAVHAGVLRTLLGLRGMAAVEPGPQDADADNPTALARALGADEVLVSQLECDPRVCQVVLKRVQGSDGRILWNGRFTGRIENLLDLSLSVADQVRGAYPEVEQREGVADLRVSPEDYEAFLCLKERYWSREGAGVVDEVLQELASLRRSSPGFLEAYDFEVRILAARFEETRQPEDLERGLELVERGRELAPGDPRILKAAAKIFQVSGKTEEAYRELEALEQWEPGDADYLALKAGTLRREGRLEEARSLMEEVVARRPAWNYFASFALLDRETGDPETARRHLEEMLSRAPDNYYCQSRLAQFELESGNVERATELYEEVVRRSPEATELNNLGLSYSFQGRFVEAAQTYRRVLKLSPGSPFALLNLADAELLAGNPAAKEMYEKLLEQIARDPDPDALLSIKAQALAQLGRTEEAVATMQRALRRSPDDPLVAYVAAVVYCVVGEETSALLHARRALDSGIDRIWFDFTWFDRIRDRLSPGAEPGR